MKLKDLNISKYDIEYNLQTHKPKTCIKPIECNQCAHNITNCKGKTKQ